MSDRSLFPFWLVALLGYSFGLSVGIQMGKKAQAVQRRHVTASRSVT